MPQPIPSVTHFVKPLPNPIGSLPPLPMLSLQTLTKSTAPTPTQPIQTSKTSTAPTPTQPIQTSRTSTAPTPTQPMQISRTPTPPTPKPTTKPTPMPTTRSTTTTTPTTTRQGSQTSSTFVRPSIPSLMDLTPILTDEARRKLQEASRTRPDLRAAIKSQRLPRR